MQHRNTELFIVWLRIGGSENVRGEFKKSGAGKKVSIALFMFIFFSNAEESIEQASKGRKKYQHRDCTLKMLCLFVG